MFPYQLCTCAQNEVRFTGFYFALIKCGWNEKKNASTEYEIFYLVIAEMEKISSANGYIHFRFYEIGRNSREIIKNTKTSWKVNKMWKIEMERAKTTKFTDLFLRIARFTQSKKFKYNEAKTNWNHNNDEFMDNKYEFMDNKYKYPIYTETAIYNNVFQYYARLLLLPLRNKTTHFLIKNMTNDFWIIFSLYYVWLPLAIPLWLKWWIRICLQFRTDQNTCIRFIIYLLHY